MLMKQKIKIIVTFISLAILSALGFSGCSQKRVANLPSDDGQNPVKDTVTTGPAKVKPDPRRDNMIRALYGVPPVWRDETD